MADIFNSVTSDIIATIIIGLAGFLLINPIRSVFNRRKKKKEQEIILHEKMWELSGKVFSLEKDIRSIIFLVEQLENFERTKMDDYIPPTADALNAVEDRSLDTIEEICNLDINTINLNPNLLNTTNTIKVLCKNIKRIITLHHNDSEAKRNLLTNQLNELKIYHNNLIEHAHELKIHY